jgi:hypothetical protein
MHIAIDLYWETSGLASLSHNRLGKWAYDRSFHAIGH